MRLFWSSRSPFVRKVMVAAHETGAVADIELIRVSVGSALMSDDVMAHNPLNKIPTLVLADGMSLFDSRVIVDYIDGLGSAALIPADRNARLAALRWQALGDGIMENATATIGERKRDPAMHSQKHDDAYRRKTAATVDLLEREAPALAAAPLNVGGIAIACALAHLDFRFAEENWRGGRPRLASWFDGIALRPSFTGTAYDEIY